MRPRSRMRSMWMVLVAMESGSWFERRLKCSRRDWNSVCLRRFLVSIISPASCDECEMNTLWEIWMLLMTAL